MTRSLPKRMYLTQQVSYWLLKVWSTVIFSRERFCIVDCLNFVHFKTHWVVTLTQMLTLASPEVFINEREMYEGELFHWSLIRLLLHSWPLVAEKYIAAGWGRQGLRARTEASQMLPVLSGMSELCPDWGPQSHPRTGNRVGHNLSLALHCLLILLLHNGLHDLKRRKISG